MHKSFVITAVRETRTSNKTSLTSNTTLKNYSFESTPTSTAGETLLYNSSDSHPNHDVTLTF